MKTLTPIVVCAAIALSNYPRAVAADLIETVIASISHGDNGAAQKLIEEHPELLEATEPASMRSPCDGYRPLHYAAWSKNSIIVEWLIKRGANVNAPAYADNRGSKSGGGRTPLHVAAESGDLSIVRLLIEAKADPNAADDAKTRPIHLAIPHRDVTKFLLEHGSRPDVFTAAGTGDVEFLRQCIAKNPSAVLETIGCSETPLHFAAHNGQLDAIKTLIDAKADINAQLAYIGNFGHTPLCEAAVVQNIDAMALLLARGADPTKGQSLTTAVLNQDVGALKLLLKYKASIDDGGVWGCSPLQLAVQHNFEEVARVLLEGGADPNTRDKGNYFPNGSGGSRENTPLDDAVLAQNVKMAKLLIQHGAKPHNVDVSKLELNKFLSEESDAVKSPAK